MADFTILLDFVDEGSLRWKQQRLVEEDKSTNTSRRMIIDV